MRNASITIRRTKERKMKPALSKVVVTAALFLIAVAAQAQTATCTNSTLRGTYAFRVSGEVFTPNGIVNRDGVAMTHFDGNGGLKQVDYVMANGSVVPGPPNPYGFHDGETGNYTVNPDCTGNATIIFPIPKGGISGAVITLMFVIGDEGRTLHTIVSSLTPPNTTTPVPANIHSDAVRVSGKLAAAASAAGSIFPAGVNHGLARNRGAPKSRQAVLFRRCAGNFGSSSPVWLVSAAEEELWLGFRVGCLSHCYWSLDHWRCGPNKRLTTPSYRSW